MRKERLFLLLAAIFLSLSTYSQSVTPATLNATGGTYTFTNYRIEWSFGESMAVNTMSSLPNIIVTNGVLQPGTNTPATINNTSTWDRDEIRILPNPTQNVIEIDFFSKQQGKVSLNLYDGSGRLLAQRQFDYFGTGRIERWDLSRYRSGIYFLHIQLAPSGTSVAKKGFYKVIKFN